MLSRRRLATIRAALDVDGYRDTPILSYAAKYASIFYGPFREAAEFGYAWGDRKSYQMNPANFAEALWEVQLDIEEEAGHISYWAKEFASWVCRGLSYGRMPFLWANFFVGEHSFRRGCSLTILKEEIEFDAYR